MSDSDIYLRGIREGQELAEARITALEAALAEAQDRIAELEAELDAALAPAAADAGQV